MQVSVDGNFARFGEKSYAINKINTVEVRTVHPYGNGWAWVCAILSVLFAYGAYNLIKDGKSPAISVILCLVFASISHWVWRRSKIVEFQLFLMTSSTSMQAYSSFDQDEISDLRTRIEAAMVAA
ncbi:hypothetical protein F1640_11250 [Novosphingobium sp. NBM11]|uniref:DUF6232 family protein n=1 Tax=Novosphingobium sp. NBM11 TaxID=2596914 RepID=UPI0018923537|nr:DUF6232 family protein [Novosphingobium sp. NBM11]MBF5090579.1 hypothetical protein [Novosphingobium sp. NBM11]